jgi:anti-sigma factor (TIGR02949 family)
LSDIDFRSCAQVFARLEDYVDRELSRDDLLQVERHLEICANCAEEFRVEGEVLRAIRDRLARIALPPGLEARVWRRLNARAAADPNNDPPAGV